ncbi:MAG TPA: acetolactate synthase small subunit [Candidatus Limnocylindrales bacterium]|nr:acetolactate synthase small subunit [Candidatus Limnocylindrales bacterium]
MLHTLSLLVRNHPGVLSHVAGLFTRRGYNIESISVGVTENPELSRMTIAVGGDERVVQQIIKQCQKLVDVLSIKDLKYDESITRELAVFVVKTPSNQSRAEIIQIAGVFNARVADMSETSIMIEVTGNQRQIDSITRLLAQYGIEEMARTGIVALTFPSKRKPEDSLEKE